MMWNRYNDGSCLSNGFFWIIFIIIAIIIALIISLIIYIIIKQIKSNNRNNRLVNNDSLSILNERLAKGEIDIEEYTKLKNTIIK